MRDTATKERATFTLSPAAKGLAESCSEQAGLSQSAWVEKAIVYYALRESGPTFQPDDQTFTEALADEEEAALADDEFHQRGAA
ncbi:hypothetical protein ACFHYQ_29280 [Sphaerimonospora cavernae]|uniref:CopG family transcriptional regulator n=1 Tax=Sphaerimonospora cavernae TaxID=1740611 RepID=A0ABV6UDY6_9ACTN